MRQSSGITPTVSFCSDTHSFSPQLHIVWVRQTYFPLLLVGKMSEALLISTRGFHHNEDTGVVPVGNSIHGR